MQMCVAHMCRYVQFMCAGVCGTPVQVYVAHVCRCVRHTCAGAHSGHRMLDPLRLG